MNTSKFVMTLGVGTALVLAAPMAVAEAPSGEAPESAESPAPAAAVPPADSALDPVPEPAPESPDEIEANPAETPPEPPAGPAAEPAPGPGAGAVAQSAPKADATPPPKPAEEPGTDPAPEDTDTPPTPEPDADTGADPASEATPDSSGTSGVEAAQQPPGAPTPQAPSGGQAPCVLTSSGLSCDGPTDCVITSSGVTCGSNCTLTSAGISCSPGEVQPNPPRGGVLPNEPVSGGPKRTPRTNVRPERESQSPAEVQEQVTSATEELPFTGAPLLLWLAVGSVLCAGGMLLRRRTSPDGPLVESATEDKHPRLPSSEPQQQQRSPGHSILIPSLVLLACVVLARGRRGRR